MNAFSPSTGKLPHVDSSSKLVSNAQNNDDRRSQAAEAAKLLESSVSVNSKCPVSAPISFEATLRFDQLHESWK
jgi:hypothetical protein